jgi:hypothetical protein
MSSLIYSSEPRGIRVALKISAQDNQGRDWVDLAVPTGLENRDEDPEMAI